MQIMFMKSRMRLKYKAINRHSYPSLVMCPSSLISPSKYITAKNRQDAQSVSETPKAVGVKLMAVRLIICHMSFTWSVTFGHVGELNGFIHGWWLFHSRRNGRKRRFSDFNVYTTGHHEIKWHRIHTSNLLDTPSNSFDRKTGRHKGN